MTYFQFLRDEANSRDMNADGSTPIEFFVENNETDGRTLVIERVCGKIRDASIRLNRFAGIAALTNGLKIEQHSADGVVLFDFLDGETIKALDDFAPLAGVDAPSVAGTGDDTWMLRWTIAKCGTPLTLQAGEKLVVTVQDDLTDLTEFYLEVQGAWSF